MPAAYDKYDYTSYWEGREYEHDSEVVAIKGYLEQIPEIGRVLEIGGGFGRHVPNYIYRAKKAVLTDPSAKNLSIARKNLQNYKNLVIKQISLENALHKFRRKSFDLIIMIRVMHHIEDIDKAFSIISSLLDNNGYLVFEFANKLHFKAIVENLLKGNFSFITNEKPIDRRSQKMIKKGTLPFVNYHPETIRRALEKYGFKVIERRSVSNIRSPFLKKYLPESFMLYIEKLLQIALAYVNFGPSIFILAKKRG